MPFQDRPAVAHSGVPAEDPEEIKSAQKQRRWKIDIGTDAFVTGLFTPHHKQDDTDLSPLPIIRTGIIARLCNDKERFPLEDGTGREIKGHLLELHSIGGLSGSPVFANPMEINMNSARAALQTAHIWIGLISGHWPGDEELNQHLGISIMTPKVSIIEVIHHPDLITMREEAKQKEREKNAPVLDDIGPPSGPTQRTKKGYETPIPKRDDVMDVFKKATRKREKK